MPRTKRVVDSELEKEMLRTAGEWKRFRYKNKLSQKFLAEILTSSSNKVCRRTIQSIESAKVIPQKATVDAFEKLRTKYEANGKPTGKRKSNKTKEDEGDF